ncbi:MAG: hypothetical protein WBM02_00770 [bacterium]
MLNFITKMMFILAFVFPAMAQIPGLDAFEIGDIKSIALEDNGAEVIVKVSLIFRNNNEFDVKLRSGKFKILAIPKTGEKILIGTSQVQELYLPGKASNQVEKEDELSMVLGSNRAQIIKKLTALLLSVASEQDQLNLILEGECDVGIKQGNNWQYLNGLMFEFSLDNKIDWDILFEKTTKEGVTIIFGDGQTSKNESKLTQ